MNITGTRILKVVRLHFQNYLPLSPEIIYIAQRNVTGNTYPNGPAVIQSLSMNAIRRRKAAGC
jgi:hypothetical protein